MTKEPPSPASRVETASQHSVLLCDYMEQIAPTDNLPQHDLRPVLLGLFGEVGSVMATAKKLHREKEAYAGYQSAVVEEFGDALWYFTALCRRLDYGIDDIFSRAASGESYGDIVAASDLVDGPLARILAANDLPPLDEILLRLGATTAALLAITGSDQENQSLLHAFAVQYLQAVQTARVPFAQIVRTNTVKARGRFLEPDAAGLPTFDSAFPEEERLPEHFEIKITQRKSGQSYLQLNGVFIGYPLTDNILDPDGYRFHDVFHFAHAAILHWSPTFRALIKQKRKSDPKYDEVQDGGRAIVVEEGLTAWIFSCAKDLNFFEGQQSLSLDLLKTVHRFVRGYEVEACPLKLWEHAILEGYKVFRHVRQNHGGIIVGDRTARTVSFKPIAETRP